MYILLGISITLAVLLIVNVLIAIGSSAIWRVASRRANGWSARVRAEAIFALRFFPVFASFLFVGGYIVPAYLLHEPFESGEVVSDKLAMIAIISSIAVSIAVYRIVHTFIATRRLVSQWLNGATLIDLASVEVPVYRIEHEFPVIAVTGIFRQRLFIARSVLATLTDDELSAAIKHEYGHMAARDNFKRTMLRFCRDLIIVPVGVRLDRDWADTAEAAADEFTARCGAPHALDLASALVKITRMVPAHGTASMPVAAFLLGTGAGDVTARVRNLLRLSEQHGLRDKTRFLSPPGLLWLGGLLVMLSLPLLDSDLHLTTHYGIEAFVQFLD